MGLVQFPASSVGSGNGTPFWAGVLVVPGGELVAGVATKKGAVDLVVFFSFAEGAQDLAIVGKGEEVGSDSRREFIEVIEGI